VLSTQLLARADAATITEANAFVFNGNRFHTLDDVKYDTPNWNGSAQWKACDSVNFLTLPTGWSLAPNDADSQQAINLNPWGTWQIVLADGTSWIAKPSGVTSTTPADTNELVNDANGGYHPLYCDRRILIKASGTGGLQTGPAAVTITNFVIMDGAKWATLDNADPNGGSPCAENTYYGLPSGWTIAQNTPKSRMAAGMFTWSAYRVVLSDGTGWTPKTNFFLNTVHNDTAAATNLLASNTQNNGWSTACSNRILITNTFLTADEQSKDLFVNTPTYTISNFVTFMGQDWAVADNVLPATDSSQVGCQTKYVRLPLDTDAASSAGIKSQDGQPPGPTTTTNSIHPAGQWDIASDDLITRALLLSLQNTFGTLCLTVKGGASYHWGGAQNCTDTGAGSLAFYKNSAFSVYGVTSCSRRVLVTRSTVSAPSWGSITPVNAMLRYYDWEFAVPDNTAVNSANVGCTVYPYRVDSANGWSLATPTQTLLGEAIRYAAGSNGGNIFGTYCLGLSTGASVESNTGVIGGSCPTGAISTITASGQQFVASTKCYSRPLLVRRHSTNATVSITPFTLGMKVLLISLLDNPSDGAVTTALDNLRALGIPFDWYAAFNSTTKACRFEEDLGLWKKDARGAAVGGNYYAIVMTNYDLSVTANNVSFSCLSAAQRNDLNTYKRKYGVRLVSLYTFPNPDALNVQSTGGTSAATTLTFSNTTLANGLLPNLTISLAAGQVFHYPAAIKNTALNNVAPFMKFNKTSIAAAVIGLPQGEEEMHFFFDTASWLIHGQAFGPVYLNWVTRGLYLGWRRVLLTAQIDDYFLSTETWNAVNNTKGAVAYTVSGADMNNLAQWQKDFNAKLPSGSKIVIEPIMNARGMWSEGVDEPISITQSTGFLNDALYKATLVHLTDFYWVSHTWSHIDQTCQESACNTSRYIIMPSSSCAFTDAQEYLNGCYLVPIWGSGYYSRNAQQFAPELSLSATTYAVVNDELSRNMAALMYRIFNDSVSGNGSKAYRENFSPNSLVNPRISGLFNRYAINAMTDNAITSVVGDSSRPELWPFPEYLNGGAYGSDWPPALYSDSKTAEYLKVNFYHGRWLTEAINGYTDPTKYFRQVFMIPRFPTNIYYDIKSLDELQSEFNFFYGPSGILGHVYQTPPTSSAIMDMEANRVLLYLLGYRFDPHMFHQANLISFNTTLSNGSRGVRCLVGLWIERVLQEYYKYSSLPVISVRMKDLAALYIERMEREIDCALSGTVLISGNKVVQLNITSQYPSPNGCVARLTGPKIADFNISPSTSAVNVTQEAYGPDNTLRIPIPGSILTTLPLGNPPPSPAPTTGTFVTLSYKTPSIQWPGQ